MYLPENLEDLVNLRITWEQRLAGAHLGKYAAHRPHVYTRGVLPTTQQDLRSTVPQRHNLVGVGPEGDSKGTGKTEIRQLEVAVAVDQEVLGLQIAVEDSVRVAEPNAIAELAHELLDNVGSQSQLGQVRVCALGQSPAAAAVGDWQGLHVFLEVEVEKLKDEVELVTVGVYDIKQTDYVGITHLLEQ